MKSTICLLLLFVPFSLIASSNEMNLIVSFQGTCTTNITVDPEQIEKGSRYLERARTGKSLPDNASIADIEDYYAKVQNQRTYQIEISAAQKGEKYRLVYYSPKGEYHFFTYFKEYIFNNNNLFMIFHPIQQIGVVDKAKQNQDFFINEINPLFLLYSDSFYPSSKSEKSTKELKNGQRLEKRNQKIFDADFEFSNLYREPDDSKPVKTMVRMLNYRFPAEYIWIAEYSEYKTVKDRVIPQRVKIAKVAKAVQPMESYRGSAPLVSKDTFIQLQNVNIDELTQFRNVWDLKLVNAEVDTLADDYFWPDVPNEYRYIDHRTRMNYILSLPSEQRTAAQ